MKSTIRRGLTIVELMVVIAIVSILIALILAGVQASRESARRTQCISNLTQLGLALHEYDAAFGSFPPGLSKGFSFHTAILPYIEQSALDAQIDRSYFPLDPPNVVVAQTPVPQYSCPSDAAAGVLINPGGYYGTNYAANYGTGIQAFGYNGVFRTREPKSGERIGVASYEITDGLSNTAAVSELLVATGLPDIRRTILPEPAGASNFSLFEVTCASETAPPPSSSLFERGRPWVDGNVNFTGYNHVLPPGGNSCHGPGTQEGIYSAVSNHKGGVNVLFADGHVRFTSNLADLTVWRAEGSRNGGEVAF